MLPCISEAENRRVDLSGETNIKYQIALFGDFSHILPDEETLKQCISNFFFLGFMPNTLQEFSPQNNKMEARLGFQSVRNGISITILSNRIDFFCSPIPGTPAASLTPEKFAAECVAVYSKIVSTFNPIVRRAGFVVESFLKPIDESQLSVVKGRFIVDGFDPLGKGVFKEWSVRQSTPVEVEGVVPPVHVIYNVSRADVQMGDQSGQREFSTLHLSVDVNMPTEKPSFTMDEGLVKNYINSSVALLKQVSEKLSGIAYE